MQLNWIYNVETTILSTQITESLKYETPDGGQTIHKYVNNILVKTFHKYGPDKKFYEMAPEGTHIDNNTKDEWIVELFWISDNHKDIVGEVYFPWDKGYRNKNNEIVDIGKHYGFGVNNPDDMIMVNRLCIPANLTEWWGYDEIATSDENLDNCHGLGLMWLKHKETDEIIRVGKKQPPFPCCVFPTIHGPINVTLEDIKLHNGVTR